MNNGQEALRRLQNQLRTVGGGGQNPKGLFAGGGLVVALVAGGLLLNASLFNGVSCIFLSISRMFMDFVQWMVVTVL
jgi:hypothetical protein